MPTNNGSSGGSTSVSPTKLPHRRVLLTQPSSEVPMADAPTEPISAAANLENDANAVRVIAYLTQEEGQRMDQIWLQMRGFGIRASKADIVRAALLMALDNEEGLREQLQPASTGNRAVVASITGRK